MRRFRTEGHTIHEIYESGDRVFARGSFSGTHTGDFMGMPPTGKEISVTEMNFDRFADGKPHEHRAEAGMVGLMQQLGAIPALTAPYVRPPNRAVNDPHALVCDSRARRRAL